MVDDVEEEEEEEDQVGSDDYRQKKKKRKKRNYVLDEDDYELLQESNISVPRPKLVCFYFLSILWCLFSHLHFPYHRVLSLIGVCWLAFQSLGKPEV